MDEILISGVLAQLWGVDSRLGRLTRLYNSGTDITVEQNTSAGCIISYDGQPNYMDYMYGKGTPTTAINGNATAFANPERTDDKAFTVAATGSIDNSASIGDFTKIVTSYPEWENASLPDANLVEVFFFLYAKLSYIGGTADATYVQVFESGASIPPRLQIRMARLILI